MEQAKLVIRAAFSTAARKTIAACLIGAALAGGSIQYYNYRNTGYSVKYEDKFFGYVRDIEYVSKAFDAAKTEIMKQDPIINIDHGLQFEKILIGAGKLTDAEKMAQIVESNLYIQYTFYSIAVNGKEMAMVRSEEEAGMVIEGIRKHFRDNETNIGVQVVDVDIKDNISIIKKITDTSRIIDVKAAVEKIMANKDPTAENETCLNVETTIKVVSNEKIPYETSYIDDKTMFEGQSKEVLPGEYGTNRVERQITKVNGKGMAITILGSSIVKSPITRVIARGTKQIFSAGRIFWPTSGTLSSYFRSRGGSHKGIDIASPMGSPINAAESGKVIFAQNGWNGGYGNKIVISHDNGYTTTYAHCSSISVQEGQTVTKGQLIGKVGSTGDSDGPHVHFEVRFNDIPQNPLSFLR